MSKLFLINFANLLKTDLLKICTEKDYNFDYKKIYHNLNNYGKEPELPFIRYYLQNDKLVSNDESLTLEEREVTLLLTARLGSGIDVDNTNDLMINGYKAIEDFIGYTGGGDWITKDNQIDLSSLTFESHIYQPNDIKDPQFLNDNKEVEVQTNFLIKYFQKLK